MKLADASVNSLRITLAVILIWLIYKSLTVEYSIGSSSNKDKRSKNTLQHRLESVEKRLKKAEFRLNDLEDEFDTDTQAKEVIKTDNKKNKYTTSAEDQ